MIWNHWRCKFQLVEQSGFYVPDSAKEKAGVDDGKGKTEVKHELEHFYIDNSYGGNQD